MDNKFDYSDEINLAVQLCRAGARRKAPMSPVFLHFSDIHNSAEHFSAVMDFYSKNRELITDVVLTGDIVAARFSQGLEPIVAEYLRSVLCVLGNHDALGGNDGWDWSQVVAQPELYEFFFKNRAEGHEIVIEEHKTYWYKDFEAYKLRIIGLNSVLKSDPEQLEWLKVTLEDARLKDFCVIIAEHYPPSNAKAIPCNFSSVTITPDELPGGALSEAVQEAVDGFKRSGGEFVCYLCGHTHTDFIFINKNYPDQLFVTVDSANIGQAVYWSDTYRIKNTKSAELFNLFSYDTIHKVVKIVRIGANADCMLRSKRSLCINYLTGEIISST